MQCICFTSCVLGVSTAFTCMGVHPLKGFVHAQGKLTGIWKEFHLDFLYGKSLAVFIYGLKQSYCFIREKQGQRRSKCCHIRIYNKDTWLVHVDHKHTFVLCSPKISNIEQLHFDCKDINSSSKIQTLGRKHRAL